MEKEVLHKKKTLAPKLRFKGFVGDWQMPKLGERMEIFRGASPRPQGDPRYYGGNVPRLMIQDVTRDGKYAFPKIDFLTEEGAKKSRFLKKGSIVLSCSGTRVAIPGILGVDACIHDGWLSFKNFKEVDTDFLFNLFVKLHERMQGSATTGGVFNNLTTSIVKDLRMGFPTLPEQEKIASFLSVVDEKIQQLTRKKELLEQYKKGVMQQLFSGKLRFRDENGKAFPKWEEKRLGDVCEYKNGGSFENLVCEDGMYNLISLNSIDINGKLKAEHKKVSETDNSLSKGDLVMVLSDVAHGYFLGMTDVIPSDNFVLNQRMGALKPKVNINRYFLKTIINANQRYFKLMGQGSSQKNLSKDDVLNFTFQQPTFDEQKKIADYLSNLDNKIESVTKQITQTQTFKKGLLQQMFV